jgi:hypothetical protein
MSCTTLARLNSIFRTFSATVGRIKSSVRRRSQWLVPPDHEIAREVDKCNRLSSTEKTETATLTENRLNPIGPTDKIRNITRPRLNSLIFRHGILDVVGGSRLADGDVAKDG